MGTKTRVTAKKAVRLKTETRVSRVKPKAAKNPVLRMPESDPVLVAELQKIGKDLKRKGYKPKCFPKLKGAKDMTVREVFGLDE